MYFHGEGLAARLVPARGNLKAGDRLLVTLVVLLVNSRILVPEFRRVQLFHRDGDTLAPRLQGNLLQQELEGLHLLNVRHVGIVRPYLDQDFVRPLRVDIEHERIHEHPVPVILFTLRVEIPEQPAPCEDGGIGPERTRKIGGRIVQIHGRFRGPPVKAVVVLVQSYTFRKREHDFGKRPVRK